jgi:hypothetical protein
MAQEKQAKTQDKDLITRLADAGEDAIQRLGELPGGKAMVGTANAFKERLDDVAVRIRSIDPLEKRVAQLEKRLDSLEVKDKRPARGTTAAPTKARSVRPRTPPHEVESAAPSVAPESAQAQPQDQQGQGASPP